MWNRLPAPAIEAGRRARTLLLRGISPLDRAWRRVRRRPSLPPLWLRRHAGPVDRFESSAADCLRDLADWRALRPGALVVDIGCGPGAMAIALRGELGPEGRYVGVDVHAPSIAWCRRAFGSDSRFRFEVADVRSSYGAGRLSLSAYRLPVADASADLILAKSLFTHLSAEEAQRYLAEISRTLSPNGFALVTAFLFAGEPVPAFPHGTGSVRWRVKNRPAAAIAFARPRFEEMILEAGLRVEKTSLGFYPGTAEIPVGQDVLLLRGREPSAR